jgi:multiple antibiotic resistance protein
MFLEKFFLSFVPLFFAMDAIGVMPVFLGLAEHLDRRERRTAIVQMVLTATGVGIGFVLCGRTLFRLMGITMEDFMVAGGSLLFLIAAGDLLSGRKLARRAGPSIGAVPMGTPLIVGPAVLTMALMLVDLHGWAATIAALVTNILVAGVLLLSCELVRKALGQTGAAVASKVASLFLAAIAVMIVRKGVAAAIQQMCSAEAAT